MRGLAKPCGYRLPASSTLTFAKRCLAVLPQGLAQALGPLLHQIADMTVTIKQYDRADPEADRDRVSGDTGADQSLWRRPSHGVDLRPDAGQTRSASSEVAMSAAISACGRDAASPVTATLNLESPRPVTGICDSCWSSAPTMSSDHTAKTQPCEDGVSAWVPVAAVMREDEPWWPSLGSLLSCCIASGSHRRSTCRSTK